MNNPVVVADENGHLCLVHLVEQLGQDARKFLVRYGLVQLTARIHCVALGHLFLDDLLKRIFRLFQRNGGLGLGALGERAAPAAILEVHNVAHAAGFDLGVVLFVRAARCVEQAGEFDGVCHDVGAP